MAFVIPGAVLLFAILMAVLPWQYGIGLAVAVIGTLFTLTLVWRAETERKWRKIVYDAQIRHGARPEEARAMAAKARLDWGPVDS